MNPWKSRIARTIRTPLLALLLLSVAAAPTFAQRGFRGGGYRGGYRGGYVGRPIYGGYGGYRGYPYYGGGYGYRNYGYGLGGVGLGLGLGLGLANVGNYGYNRGYGGYYGGTTTVYTTPSVVTTTAPYAVGQTYLAPDGVTYPLYYNPSTGGYIYYPNR